MDINNVFSSIPSVIGSLYEVIYLVSKDLGLSYSVHYTGDKLRVSSPGKYSDFVDYLKNFKEDSLNEVENNEIYKKVLINKNNEEKLISVVTKENYKLVFVMDISMVYDFESEKKILLIADDSPVITKFFKKTFKDEYEVLIAHDGNEAIQLVNQYLDKNFVGFFCDLQMPEKSGYDVLEYFKENNLFEKLPVSVISGEESKEGIEKATSYNIVDMLQKPFNAEAARDIVNKTVAFSPKNNESNN